MSDVTTGLSAGGGPQPGAGAGVPGAGSGMAGQVGSVAGAAKDQAGEVAGTAAEQAKSVARDARSEGRRLVEESRQQLQTQAAEQTSRLAGSVREVSEQLRAVGRGEAPPQGLVADVTRQAADAAASMAGRLESTSPEQLLDDVRRFARARPGMFLAGAVAAGFVTGRLFRAVDTQGVIEAAKSGVRQDNQDDEGDRSEGRTAAERTAFVAGGSERHPHPVPDAETAASPTVATGGMDVRQ